jgi:hypothetical protein
MIHIIQCLCPDRHAIMGIAYDPKDMSPEEAMQAMREWVQGAIDTHVINPWCAICGSSMWQFEDGVSKFHTLEEAQPVLRESELKQEFTNRILGRY